MTLWTAFLVLLVSGSPVTVSAGTFDNRADCQEFVAAVEFSTELAGSQVLAGRCASDRFEPVYPEMEG